jgi:hypothetical protein
MQRRGTGSAPGLPCPKSVVSGGTEGEACLHCDHAVVDHDFLGEKVGADGCFVLVAKLFVDVLVHERRLAHAAVQKSE